jgi:hypothetical protein
LVAAEGDANFYTLWPCVRFPSRIGVIRAEARLLAFVSVILISPSFGGKAGPRVRRRDDDCGLDGRASAGSIHQWSCEGSDVVQASPRPCGVVPSPLAPRDILRSLLPNPYAVSCFPLPVASVVASSVIRVHERPGSQVAGCVSAAGRERCALLRSTVPPWHQPCAGRFSRQRRPSFSSVAAWLA